MKVAIVGSRDLIINDLEHHLPEDTTEIVSGGARGIDSCAKAFALANGYRYTEFLPEYEKYGKVAPILRNKDIVNYSDLVIIFWDGESRGSKSVIDFCKKYKKQYIIKTPKTP